MSRVLENSKLSLDIVGLLPDPCEEVFHVLARDEGRETVNYGHQDSGPYLFSRGRARNDVNQIALDPA